MTLLKDEEWGEWSNIEIAKQCGVGDDLVRSLRLSLPENGSERSRTYTTKHGTEATMNVEIDRRDPVPRRTPGSGSPVRRATGDGRAQ